MDIHTAVRDQLELERSLTAEAERGLEVARQHLEVERQLHSLQSKNTSKRGGGTPIRTTSITDDFEGKSQKRYVERMMHKIYHVEQRSNKEMEKAISQSVLSDNTKMREHVKSMQTVDKYMASLGYKTSPLYISASQGMSARRWLTSIRAIPRLLEGHVSPHSLVGISRILESAGGGLATAGSMIAGAAMNPAVMAAAIIIPEIVSKGKEYYSEKSTAYKLECERAANRMRNNMGIPQEHKTMNEYVAQETQKYVDKVAVDRTWIQKTLYSARIPGIGAFGDLGANFDEFWNGDKKRNEINQKSFERMTKDEHIVKSLFENRYKFVGKYGITTDMELVKILAKQQGISVDRVTAKDMELATNNKFLALSVGERTRLEQQTTEYDKTREAEEANDKLNPYRAVQKRFRDELLRTTEKARELSTTDWCHY